ncbi:MAG: ATP-binding protein [Candidatus Dormibacteria bacterium]
MNALVLVLQYAVALGFLAVTAVAYREWLVWRGADRAYLAVATALLTAVSFLTLVSAAVSGVAVVLLADLRVACFLGAGFALFLFRHVLVPVRRGVLVGLGALCAGALAVTAVVLSSSGPSAGMRAASDAVILVAWLACVGEPVLRLWRLARDRPAVQHARLRALSAGYAGILALTVIATLGSSLTARPAVRVGLELLSLAIIPVLYVSFAPPRWLRRLWRQREEDAYSAAMRDLLLFSPDRATLATRATDWAIRLVGGDGAILVGSDGSVLARTGLGDAEVGLLKASLLGSSQEISHRPLDPSRSAILIPSRSDQGAGGLAVVAGAFTPIFRSDEMTRLEQYVAATTAALERVSLVESLRQHEDEVRVLNRDLERRVDQRTAQLQASNRELEAFSYTVSHDLRAPLRAVDGFARILLEDYERYLPDDGKRYLRLVGSNAKDMGELIDALLNFSRLSRAPLRRQEVAFTDIVRHAVTLASGDLGDRKVEFKICDLPLVRTDPVLLQEVYANLIGNAVKFTRDREHAVIEVGAQSTADRPGEDAFYVRDNGIGFDMRYADKIFGVFHRLHRGDDYDGTGAGLAIVQRIINRHGGRVWADALQGQGATFYFTLGGDEIDD